VEGIGYGVITRLTGVGLGSRVPQVAGEQARPVLASTVRVAVRTSQHVVCTMMLNVIGAIVAREIGKGSHSGRWLRTCRDRQGEILRAVCAYAVVRCKISGKFP